MILPLLVSVLLPQLIAFLLISILWPTESRSRFYLPIKLCLSAGTGFGIVSCLYFLQLSVFGPSRRKFVAALGMLLVILIVAFLFRLRSRQNSRTAEEKDESQPRSRLRLVLSALFALAVVSAAVSFVFISLKQPHGEWDAWAVYNMKARFLFRGGEYWKDIFIEPTGWTSPDYPLLVPAAIAACWTVIKRDAVVVPIIIAFLFTFGTIGVVGRGVSILRGKTQGLLAALLLICTPFLIVHGANQYTDVPLAFFLAATLVLLHLHERVEYGGDGFLIL